MKCVKRQDGTIDRVSDETAERLVKQGGAKYVSKSAYKATRTKTTNGSS